jgi:ketosteroid isomerase-like protein
MPIVLGTRSQVQRHRIRKEAVMHPDRTSDERDVRRSVDAWASALSAKDASAVTSHYTPDYVQFSMAPPLQTKGGDPRSLQAWFDTWEGPIGYAVGEAEIATGGDLAVMHGLCRMSGTKVGGDKVDLWFRQTLGLRKAGGIWQIAHQHTSVPFYMDGSFNAAVDLAP